ncbi:MAG: hypothetical protein ACLR43_03370 [Faecalibacillus faecis]
MTTSGDLYDIKDRIHKIQLAFKEELNKEEFSHLDVLSFHKQSRVIIWSLRETSRKSRII